MFKPTTLIKSGKKLQLLLFSAKISLKKNGRKVENTFITLTQLKSERAQILIVPSAELVAKAWKNTIV